MKNDNKPFGLRFFSEARIDTNNEANHKNSPDIEPVNAGYWTPIDGSTPNDIDTGWDF